MVEDTKVQFVLALKQKEKLLIKTKVMCKDAECNGVKQEIQVSSDSNFDSNFVVSNFDENNKVSTSHKHGEVIMTLRKPKKKAKVSDSTLICKPFSLFQLFSKEQ